MLKKIFTLLFIILTVVYLVIHTQNLNKTHTQGSIVTASFEKLN
jgi:hypothetical protein